MYHKWKPFVLFTLVASTSYGYQVASFNWRSTQGWAIDGPAQISKESIRLTVEPDHLDVEHELEIVAQNGWSEPDFPNSLEILGALIFESKTTITGLLLWNGDQILKGKLQTKDLARKKYEEVVDRNVKNPPPPRDPAILEKIDEKTYQLSVFPVSLGASRKLRIRYVIPADLQDSTFINAFPNAFSQIAEVTIRAGEGLPGYVLTSRLNTGGTKSVRISDEASVPIQLDPEAYGYFQPPYWYAGSKAHLQSISRLFDQPSGSIAVLAPTEDSQGASGFAGHFLFKPPADLFEHMEGDQTTVSAMISSESDSVLKQFALLDPETFSKEHLRIFSASELEEDITWRVYENGDLIKELVETPQVIRLENGNQFLRSFASEPFYPLSRSMPASLAASWGFIDSRYALLALEQDSLRRELRDRYADAGVPELDPEDIFADDADSGTIPLSAWLIQKNIDLEELLQPTTNLPLNSAGLPAGIRWVMRNGFLHLEFDPEWVRRGLSVTLYGLNGKELKSWDGAELSRGKATWSPGASGYKQGICLMKVSSGQQSWSMRILLR